MLKHILDLEIEERAYVECISIISKYPIHLLNREYNGFDVASEIITEFTDNLNDQDLNNNFSNMLSAVFEYITEETVKRAKDKLTKYIDSNFYYQEYESRQKAYDDHKSGYACIILLLAAYVIFESGFGYFNDNPFKEIFERLNYESRGEILYVN